MLSNSLRKEIRFGLCPAAMFLGVSLPLAVWFELGAAAVPHMLAYSTPVGAVGAALFFGLRRSGNKKSGGANEGAGTGIAQEMR